MGRFLEVLRQDPPSIRATEPPHTFSTDWVPSADKIAPTPNADSDIPFIEVGPHRFFDASPGILAATAASRDAGPILAAPIESRPVALASPPRRPETRRSEPRKVFFREIPPECAPLPMASDLVAYHAPDHPVSQQYRKMVEAMMGIKNGPRLMLFTAARGEAGTTTAVLNLALSAARLGRSVLVVDANLRRPGIAERLGLPEAPGLRELLAGATPLDEAVRRTAQHNLQAIAAGLKPAAANPRLPNDTTPLILSRLRERFQLVFVDGPSWDGRPDLVALGRACDAVYLVLPEAEAESHEADSLCQLIPEQGARLAGCILSQV